MVSFIGFSDSLEKVLGGLRAGRILATKIGNNIGYVDVDRQVNGRRLCQLHSGYSSGRAQPEAGR